MIKQKIKIIFLTALFIISFIGVTTVEAAKNNNPMLKDIKIEGYNIEPNFEMFTTEYIVVIEEDIDKLEIEAIPDDKNATVKIEGNENLKIGRNEIKIEVTAEDGKAKEEYYIFVTKGNKKTANANLKELEIKDAELAPKFNKDVIDYAFEYPENLQKVEIRALPEEDGTKVEIIGNENLKEPIENIEIKVTAKDGQTIKTYYLIAKKAGQMKESLEGKLNEEEIVKTSEIEDNEQEKIKEKLDIIIYLVGSIIIISLLIILINFIRKRSKK